MEISRVWAYPSKNTFKMAHIKGFVEKYLPKDGVVIDPFANSCKYGTITNDLNPEFGTDYNLDALEFLKLMETDSADMVLYDPPYSMRQASEVYKSYGKEQLAVTNGGYWRKIKDEIARITKRGGIVLSFGWDSNGIGKCRGFEIEEVMLVAHGGSIKHDTICTMERKVR